MRFPHTPGLVGLIFAVGGLFTACTVQAQSLIGQSSKFASPVRDDYRSIHQEPELGKQETKTAAFVRDRLKAAGFTDVRTVEGLPTAVIAVLETGRAGPVTAFRSELDGRKTQEESGLPYASKVANSMHSCGHDAHTAILLNLATLASQNRARLKGRIVFVFQPAEETAGGADDIVNANILVELKVERIFALHVAPSVPVGTVSVSPGAAMAASTYFTVRIEGKGGHAAAPQETSDLPVLTAQMVDAVTHLPARHLDVIQRPAVISVARIEAGQEGATNVLPGTASFSGTIRSFEDTADAPSGGQSIQALFEQTVSALAAPNQGQVKVEWRKGSPPTVNNSGLYSEAIPRLRAQLPKMQVTESSRYMFAEDFAYYTSQVPALYMAFGVQKDGLGEVPVHSSKFTIHLDALDVGRSVFTALLEQWHLR